MATSFSKDDFRRIRLSLAAAIVMAAVGGAIVYASMLNIGLQALGLSAVAAAWISMAVVLVARLLAMAFRITLPTYSERK